MFWVTLRQRVQELRQRRQSATAADIAAPLQLTVSTAASGNEYDVAYCHILIAVSLVFPYFAERVEHQSVTFRFQFTEIK